MKKLLTFFFVLSKNISFYAIFNDQNFNNTLTTTSLVLNNNILSFGYSLSPRVKITKNVHQLIRNVKNPTFGHVRPAKKFRLACIFVQSDQNLLCVHFR